MSMNGVDIAGYQKGIDVRSLTADFVIVKVTEGVQGTRYNPDYRSMADAALASGKLLGFYHYANGGNPVEEADSFFNAIKDYRGKAIPCLDWEGTGNPVFCSGMDVGWCKSFLDRIAERMGATPMLYTGKNVCNTYDWSPCVTYPLWGAQYAYEDHVYQDYESNPWQSALGWGAWGHDIAIHQYGYVLPKPNDGGVGALDGDICYLSREEWQRMCGEKGGGKQMVSIADVAARIHHDMVTDERNGYSQAPTRWGGDYGGTKTLEINGRSYTYPLGSYDCSSSCILAWRLALQGTKYEGSLDAATYTGDMRAVFINSGLFTASYTPAKRGDLYLSDGHHVAMCQDGGSDGVFGYDCLSEFNRNEMHSATGGRAGDQDGQESVLRAYYSYPWSTVLHYNGKADYEVEEQPKPSPAPEPAPQVGGTYRCVVSALNVRDQPSTKGRVVTQYHKGQTVTLDAWSEIADGCVWGRYKGASSGKLRYVAVSKGSSDYLVRVV